MKLTPIDYTEDSKSGPKLGFVRYETPQTGFLSGT